MIRAGEAGGVILSEPNISSRSQIRNVVAQLRQAALAGPLHRKRLILTDQEGGEVRRFSGEPILAEKQIGEARNGLALALSAEPAAAENLKGVGVNVNLAPGARRLPPARKFHRPVRLASIQAGQVRSARSAQPSSQPSSIAAWTRRPSIFPAWAPQLRQ